MITTQLINKLKPSTTNKQMKYNINIKWGLILVAWSASKLTVEFRKFNRWEVRFGTERKLGVGDHFFSFPFPLLPFILNKGLLQKQLVCEAACLTCSLPLQKIIIIKEPPPKPRNHFPIPLLYQRDCNPHNRVLNNGSSGYFDLQINAFRFELSYQHGSVCVEK